MFMIFCLTKSNTISSKTLFFNVQSVNRKSYILLFGTLKVLVFLIAKHPQICSPSPRSFFNGYNHKGLRSMIRLLQRISCLREKKNSVTIFKTKTVLTLYVVMVYFWFSFFFFTVTYLIIKDHSPEHRKQNWLQINRDQGIFLNRNIN